MKIDREKAVKATEDLLTAMGVDFTKEPYKGTPERYSDFLIEMFEDRDSKLKVFPEAYHGPITLRGHEVWTLCPHHLLPVKMTVTVSYIPRTNIGNDKVKVLGLSKLPRLVDQVIRRGPALQELVTQDIIGALAEYADYAHCIIDGAHLCTMIRGVKTTGTMQTEARYQREQPKPQVSIPKIVPLKQ